MCDDRTEISIENDKKIILLLTLLSMPVRDEHHDSKRQHVHHERFRVLSSLWVF